MKIMKRVLVKEYTAQMGLHIPLVPYLSKKSWSSSSLNSQGNIRLSVGLLYIQPSKTIAIYNYTDTK
jgi:hypothetical protein